MGRLVLAAARSLVAQSHQANLCCGPRSESVVAGELGQLLQMLYESSIRDGGPLLFDHRPFLLFIMRPAEEGRFCD